METNTPSQLNKPFIPKKNDSRTPKSLRKLLPFRWIWQKVHRGNEDVIIIICGPTGMGKTTLATYLAEKLDITGVGKKRFPYFTKDFEPTKEFIDEILTYNTDYRPKCINEENFNNITPRFCFGQEQREYFWNWVKKHRDEGHNTKGIVGVFDEAQSLYSRKEHYSHKNRDAVNQLVTGRYLNTIQIFIGPEYDRIDKGIFDRVHIVIEVVEKGFDISTQKSYIAWKAWRPGRYKDYIVKKWFHKLDRTLLDTPYLTPMPSNFLWRLVHGKELFFKASDKNKVYNKYENAQKVTKVSVVDKAVEWAQRHSSRKHEYRKDGKYLFAKICFDAGTTDKKFARWVGAEWDREFEEEMK